MGEGVVAFLAALVVCFLVVRNALQPKSSPKGGAKIILVRGAANVLCDVYFLGSIAGEIWIPVATKG